MYRLLNGLHNNYLLINFQFKTVYLQQKLQGGHFALILTSNWIKKKYEGPTFKVLNMNEGASAFIKDL